MTQEKKDLALAARVPQFAALLTNSEITGKDGKFLGVEPGIAATLKMLAEARQGGNNVYVIGNGGSAAVASHVVVDFVNVAKLRASTLHEPSVITCMANDYGYENIFSRQLTYLAKPHDVLIAISSSGRSMNIRNSVAQVLENGGKVITLSGFARDNPLRSLGDINIWLDSTDYGMVEIGHQFLLHNIADRFGASLFESA